MSASSLYEPHWSVDSLEHDELDNPFQFTSSYSARVAEPHGAGYDSTSEDYGATYGQALLGSDTEEEPFVLSTPPLSPQLQSFDDTLNLSYDCQYDISQAIGQLAFNISHAIPEPIETPSHGNNVKIESTYPQASRVSEQPRSRPTTPVNSPTTGSIFITKGIKDVQDDVYVVNFDAGFEATISLSTPLNTSTDCEIIVTIDEIEELVIKKTLKTPKTSTKSSSAKKKVVKQLVDDGEIDQVADDVGQNANYFDLHFKPNSSMQRIGRYRWSDTVKIDSPLSFPCSITSECSSITFSGCVRRPIGRYNGRMGSQIPPSRMTVSMKSISDDGDVFNHSWSTIIRGGRRADDKKSIKKSTPQTSTSSSSVKTPRKRGAKRTSSSSDESAADEPNASPKRRRSIE